DDAALLHASPHLVENLFAARLDDVAQQAALDVARRVAAHTRHLDVLVVGDHTAHGAAEVALQTLGLGGRRTQAGSQVGGDVVAADGNDAAVRDTAIFVDQNVGGAAADVDHGHADFPLVLAQHGGRTGKRLQHDVGDVQAASLDGAHHVLHRRGAGRDQIHLGLQAHTAHPDGVADALLV